MKNILFGIVWISRLLFKCNYLGNQEFVQIFLFLFWNVHQILNILKKKMIAIPSLFWKLQNVKDLIRPLSKKHVCRTFFDSQHVKVSKTVVKSAWEHFHQIFASVWETLILKISPYWYVKSWGCFLLDWPPMTNIVFGFAWICCPRFKCNYL